MAKQKQTRERVFDLSLRYMKQLDLSSTAICATAEFAADNKVEEILLIFREDAFGTVADDETTAQTQLADSSTRRRFRNGETISYFYTSGKIWFVSASGASVPAAIDKEVYEQTKRKY